MAGAGLNAGPLWLYADAIDRRELIHVLPDWNPPRHPAHSLMLSGRSTREDQQRARHAASKGSQAAGSHWLSMWPTLYESTNFSVATNITRATRMASS
jgi:hypothetical protein